MNKHLVKGFRGTVFVLIVCLPAAPDVFATNVLQPVVPGLLELQSVALAAHAGTLHALFLGQFEGRPQPMLAYSQSVDGGLHWSHPCFVTVPESRPPEWRPGNEFQLGVLGPRLMAVWQSPGEFPGAGPLAVALSDDGGRTWISGASPVSGDTTRTQSYPALLVDRFQVAHLFWLDDREESGNSQGLRYARSHDGGDHWSRDTTVDPQACTCCWLRAVEYGDGGAAVLYRDFEPNDMRVRVKRPRTDDWQDLGTPGVRGWYFTGCPHCGGGLAITNRPGETVVHTLAWTGKEGQAGLYYSRTIDVVGQWTEPEVIGDGNSRDSAIAADLSNHVGVAFTGVTSQGSSVLFRQSIDGGRQWGATQTLSGPGAEVGRPRVVPTHSGYQVFWIESQGREGNRWRLVHVDYSPNLARAKAS